MPKTATRQTTSKISSNGNGAKSKTAPKAAQKMEKSDETVTDTVNPKVSTSEHQDRKKLQKTSIKNLDKELLREMLYQMVLGRVFEQKCAEVYRIGKIGGFCHLYIGQEAVGVGAILATDREKDYVITAYRDHVQAMLVGIV